MERGTRVQMTNVSAQQITGRVVARVARMQSPDPT
jgi:hypothetical protein